MKKIIVFAAALLLGLNAFAQLNVGAGYMFEYGPWREKTESGSSRKWTTEVRQGVYAGATYNFSIASFGLGIAPGAYVSWTGGVTRNPDRSKQIIHEGDYISRHGTRHLALTLPVYVTYAMDLGPGTIFAYAGPSFQVGLSLKEYDKGRDLEGRFKSTSENYYGKNYDYRVCDLKLGTGFGYRWRFIQAHVGFDFGLIDKLPNQYVSLHYHTVYMGAAYVF